MNRREFDRVAYNSLKDTGYKFLEIVATGEEIEVSPGCYKKAITVVPHKTAPQHEDHYLIDIGDSEAADMLEQTDTDVFFY
jgi:hypothetical protein